MALERKAWSEPVSSGAISDRGRQQACFTISSASATVPIICKSQDYRFCTCPLRAVENVSHAYHGLLYHVWLVLYSRQYYMPLLSAPCLIVKNGVAPLKFTAQGIVLIALHYDVHQAANLQPILLVLDRLLRNDFQSKSRAQCMGCSPITADVSQYPRGLSR